MNSSISGSHARNRGQARVHDVHALSPWLQSPGPPYVLDLERLVDAVGVVVAEHVVRARDHAARATGAQPRGDDLVVESQCASRRTTESTRAPLGRCGTLGPLDARYQSVENDVPSPVTMAKIADILREGRARRSSSSRRKTPAGRGAARADAARARAARAVVRVGDLRRRRLDARAHARPRRAHQPRHVDDRDGAPHVRRAHAGRARRDRHPLPRRRASRTSWRSAATRPRSSISRRASCTTRPSSSTSSREVGDFSVGVAVHPEAHPAVAVARRATGAHRPRSWRGPTSRSSQFFFDADVWFDLVDSMRASASTSR